MVYAAASLQGCGGRGRGGLLPGSCGNDKENGPRDGTGLIRHSGAVATATETRNLEVPGSRLRRAPERQNLPAQLGLQRRDARFQGFVLLAR